MAYVEVIRDGRIVKRRKLDPAKDADGWLIHMGTSGKMRLKAGQSATVGGFCVTVHDGDPPVEGIAAGRGDGRAKRADGRKAPPKMPLPDVEGYRVTGRLKQGTLPMP